MLKLRCVYPETHISLSIKAKNEILPKFDNAMEAAKNLERRYKSSSLLVKFIETQQERRLSDISSWIQKLTNQKSDTLLQQDKVKSYQSLLDKAINLLNNLDFLFASKLKNIPNEEVMSSTEYHTYNQCMNLQGEFWTIKNYLTPILTKKKCELESTINKINSLSQNILGWGVCAVLFSFFIRSYERELLYFGLFLIIVATIMYLYSYIMVQTKNKKARRILDDLQKR